MNLRKLQHKNPLTFYNASVACEVEIPLVFSKVSAGFPSPADDFLDLNIDLNKHLVKTNSPPSLSKSPETQCKMSASAMGISS